MNSEAFYAAYDTISQRYFNPSWSPASLDLNGWLNVGCDVG